VHLGKVSLYHMQFLSVLEPFPNPGFMLVLLVFRFCSPPCRDIRLSVRNTRFHVVESA
jgi:hypothetical protein